MKKRHVILATCMVAIGLSVYLIGYLVGAYQFFRTDVAVNILDAANIDVRPSQVSSAELEGLVNAERTKLGLVRLSHNGFLNESACSKLDDMVKKNYWSHDAPDGTTPWVFITQAGYKYRNAGENLAYGFKTAQETITGWMNSPTHKANIVGDYAEQGICSKVVKFQGTYVNLIVNHFGSPN